MRCARRLTPALGFNHGNEAISQPFRCRSIALAQLPSRVDIPICVLLRRRCVRFAGPAESVLHHDCNAPFLLEFLSGLTPLAAEACQVLALRILGYARAVFYGHCCCCIAACIAWPALWQRQSLTNHPSGRLRRRLIQALYGNPSARYACRMKISEVLRQLQDED